MEQRNTEHWRNNGNPGTVAEQRNTPEHQRKTPEQQNQTKRRTIVVTLKEILT